MYRQRSLLKRSVFPEDIAEAIYFLASDRSAKSTGNIVIEPGADRAVGDVVRQQGGQRDQSAGPAQPGAQGETGPQSHAVSLAQRG